MKLMHIQKREGKIQDHNCILSFYIVLSLFSVYIHFHACHFESSLYGKSFSHVEGCVINILVLGFKLFHRQSYHILCLYFSKIISFFHFSLKELSKFIKSTDSGLLTPIEEGDYNGMVDCMGYLYAVKERQQATDEMFEPLKQTIELLKTFEQELPEEVHLQLQVSLFFKFMCVIGVFFCW